MRIGIFGGTFDPIHTGHLIMAEQCREQADLEQLWFIPAARPPHKLDRVTTPFAQRVEMLALAVAGSPAFHINELEKDRPGPSYTVNTLEELHRLHPGTEFCLVIGADTLADLANWHEPQRVLELATLLVVARPGWPPPAVEGPLARAVRRHQIVQVPLIDISSTDLRRRAAEGRSLRYLVPRAVECYIETHRLYRPLP